MRHDSAVILHASTRPERIRTTRSQRRASSESWVTSTSVVPRSAWPANISSMISAPVRLVEIAGRLVGDQDRRVGRQRAGERDALLLAAGKLAPDSGGAAPPARPRQARPRRARGRRRRRRARAARRRSPCAVMVGIRWNDWNTMPTLRPRKRASASSSSALRVSPGDHDRAGVGPLQPRHHHQQRRFARARRADHSDRLAAPYIEVDVFEDVDARRAPAERQVDAGERDGVRRSLAAPRCRPCGYVRRSVGGPRAGARRSLIWEFDARWSRLLRWPRCWLAGFAGGITPGVARPPTAR